MRDTDVAIIGGGLTGSLAAAMLIRRGYAATLIDPHEKYRPDFRCEKLEPHHVEALEKTGLAGEILAAAHHYQGIWVARLGRLCEDKPTEEYGIDYSALVNAIRALVPREEIVQDTVRHIAVTPDRQTLTLASGEIISARLIVAANGLNAGVLAKLGMHRREISRCHSISLGFDIEPASSRFPFEALTYFGELPEQRISYLTLFPLGAGMRANLFVHREFDDPWLARFRNQPAATLVESLPRLKRLTGEFKVAGQVKVRPTDLYVTDHVDQPGIVLVGDAYATACPTSGTGASKGITDVERLCHVHVPAWLASPGMAADKIAAFYADPVKVTTDAHSLETSLFARRLAVTPGPQWAAYRLARFMGAAGRNILHQSAQVISSMKMARSQ